MNATITFNLPEEADAHQAALDGPKWKTCAESLDQTLRAWLKHGHVFKTPDEAIQAARDRLYETMQEAGSLGLYT
jgi:hypothetical protein